jgi:ABC-type uncharacterized transport system permease subunit
VDKVDVPNTMAVAGGRRLIYSRTTASSPKPLSSSGRGYIALLKLSIGVSMAIIVCIAAVLEA